MNKDMTQQEFTTLLLAAIKKHQFLIGVGGSVILSGVFAGILSSFVEVGMLHLFIGLLTAGWLNMGIAHIAGKYKNNTLVVLLYPITTYLFWPLILWVGLAWIISIYVPLQFYRKKGKSGLKEYKNLLLSRHTKVYVSLEHIAFLMSIFMVAWGVHL